MIIFIEGPELSEGNKLFKKASKSIDHAIFYDIYETINNDLEFSDIMLDRNLSILGRVSTILDMHRFNRNSIFVINNGIFYLYVKSLIDENEEMLDGLQRMIKHASFNDIKLISISKELDHVPDMEECEIEQFITESRMYNKSISDNIMYLEDVNKKNEYRLFINENQKHIDSEFILLLKHFIYDGRIENK